MGAWGAWSMSGGRRRRPGRRGAPWPICGPHTGGLSVRPLPIPLHNHSRICSRRPPGFGHGVDQVAKGSRHTGFTNCDRCPVSVPNGPSKIGRKKPSGQHVTDGFAQVVERAHIGHLATDRTFGGGPVHVDATFTDHRDFTAPHQRHRTVRWCRRWHRWRSFQWGEPILCWRRVPFALIR